MSKIDTTILVSEITVDGVAMTLVGGAEENKLVQLLNKTITKFTEKDLDGVIQLPDSFAENCDMLESVKLPNTITTLGKRAFYECSALTDIVIPNSVTSIGERQFSYTALIDVTIPDSITSLPAYTFAYCKNLVRVSLPDSLTSLGAQSFYNCSALTDITIPEGIKIIDTYTFYNCIKLKHIKLPNSLTTIGSQAFQSAGLKSIVIGDNVNQIYSQAFNSNPALLWTDDRGVQYLRNYNIDGEIVNEYFSVYDVPSTNQLVGEYTINENCKILTNAAFMYCSKLTNIIFPESITQIPSQCFYGCGFINLMLPEQITHIATYAFQACSSLENVIIGSNVISISDYAFTNCNALIEITIKAVTPPSLNNSRAIPSTVSTIYIPTGTLEAYSTATNWSAFADKFVEKDM